MSCHGQFGQVMPPIFHGSLTPGYNKIAEDLVASVNKVISKNAGKCWGMKRTSFSYNPVSNKVTVDESEDKDGGDKPKHNIVISINQDLLTLYERSIIWHKRRN